MPLYQMTVTLEMTDIVEADSPEEAFIQLSNDAMAGGSWDYTYDVVKGDENA
jgi:hypothetical protein